MDFKDMDALPLLASLCHLSGYRKDILVVGSASSWDNSARAAPASLACGKSFRYWRVCSAASVKAPRSARMTPSNRQVQGHRPSGSSLSASRALFSAATMCPRL